MQQERKCGSMTELPKIFGKNELSHSALRLGNCEMCDEHMHAHDWVVLDRDGFSIFCSNLNFVEIDRPQVVAAEYYPNETKPELFNFGVNSSMEFAERTLASAVNQAKRDIDVKNGPDRVEIYIKRNVVFDSRDIESIVRIGDWDNVQDLKS